MQLSNNHLSYNNYMINFTKQTWVKGLNMYFLRFVFIKSIILLMTIQYAYADSFHCIATTYADFADDPDHVEDKRKALLSAQNFLIETTTGKITDKGHAAARWEIIEQNGLLGTSRYMKPTYYGKILIDDFLDIIPENDKLTITFKRSIIDGMVTGVCSHIN